MGVPAFYRWLSQRYPKIIKDVVDGGEVPMPAQEFDNLYLDMNGVIHPCSHPEDGSPPPTEDAMMLRICEYIDMLVSLIRPRKLLYLAIDGVAPRAKMNQQRSRRFRAAKDSQESAAVEAVMREQWIRAGLPVPPESTGPRFDSNVITPGTAFMDRVAQTLRHYMHCRLSTDPTWRELTVVLSDASVPGEGEHKIMDYIRRARAQPGYNPDTRHVVYGLDADLIMLTLAAHEPHCFVLREEVLPTGKARYASAGHPSFQLVSVAVLREYLAAETQTALPFEWDLERVLDDFVFMCFFVGNDFLPHVPSLDIRENAMDILLNTYKRVLPLLGGYLTAGSAIDFQRVNVFVAELGLIEAETFMQIHRRHGRMRRSQYYAEKEFSRKAGLPDPKPPPPVFGPTAGPTGTHVRFDEPCQPAPTAASDAAADAASAAVPPAAAAIVSASVMVVQAAAATAAPSPPSPSPPVRVPFAPGRGPAGPSGPEGPPGRGRGRGGGAAAGRGLAPMGRDMASYAAEMGAFLAAATGVRAAAVPVTGRKRAHSTGSSSSSASDSGSDGASVSGSESSSASAAASDRAADAASGSDSAPSEVDSRRAAVSPRTADSDSDSSVVVDVPAMRAAPSGARWKGLASGAASARAVLAAAGVAAAPTVSPAADGDHADDDVQSHSDAAAADEQRPDPVERQPKKTRPERLSAAAMPQITPKAAARLGLTYTEAVKLELERRRVVSEDDTVNFHQPGYRERYYQIKFGFDVTQPEGAAALRRLVEHYVQGLAWVMRYYYEGVCSWTWYYPYHYAPLVSDLVALDTVPLPFELGTPFRPFEQLLAVLPPQSAHALPLPYRPLMLNAESSIADFYPTQFEVDMAGKRWAWMGISLLPFIEEERLLKAAASVLAESLAPDERRRNQHTEPLVIVHASSPLAPLLLDGVSQLVRSDQHGLAGVLRPAVAATAGTAALPDLGTKRPSPCPGLPTLDASEAVDGHFVHPPYPGNAPAPPMPPRLLPGVHLPFPELTADDLHQLRTGGGGGRGRGARRAQYQRRGPRDDSEEDAELQMNAREAGREAQLERERMREHMERAAERDRQRGGGRKHRKAHSAPPSHAAHQQGHKPHTKHKHKHQHRHQPPPKGGGGGGGGGGSGAVTGHKRGPGAKPQSQGKRHKPQTRQR